MNNEYEETQTHRMAFNCWADAVGLSLYFMFLDSPKLNGAKCAKLPEANGRGNIFLAD
jgi:hypothetical protein